MEYEIIDFHTHPFEDRAHNICNHAEFCGMSIENTREVFDKLGISRICGSVIRWGKDSDASVWDKVRENNDSALRLRDLYGGFYVPGFHVHPAFVEESLREIERMDREGVKLVGELVPYFDKWGDLKYDSEPFSVLLDEIGRRGMVVSFHSQDEDAMDRMVAAHPDVTFVAAHPGEYDLFMRHIARARMSENYYIDLSGYGVFRYGMLRRAIDEIGADRVLFGSDFPTCSPAMYLGAVTMDGLITEEERQMILSENAKRLLKLK